MGYLNNSVLTVDAILTTKGRELLARGDGSFRITQFALADDEIDYTLYNTSHPSGSAFYGEAIENIPILEAFPDETQVMKYKIATLPRGTENLPVLGGVPDIGLKLGGTISITPETLNYVGGRFEPNGYVFTIADVRLTSTFVGVGIATEEADRLNSLTTLGTNVSKTVIGTSLNITATSVGLSPGANKKSTVTVIGRDSGARTTVSINVTA